MGKSYPEFSHATRLQQLCEIDDTLNLGFFVVLGRDKAERLDRDVCKNEDKDG